MSVALVLGMTPADIRACTVHELVALRTIYLSRIRAAEHPEEE